MVISARLKVARPNMGKYARCVRTAQVKYMDRVMVHGARESTPAQDINNRVLTRVIG